MNYFVLNGLDGVAPEGEWGTGQVSMSEPHRISKYFHHFLLASDRWTPEERLVELRCALFEFQL